MWDISCDRAKGYYPCSQRWLCREKQAGSFELRKAVVVSSKVNLGTDKGRIPLIDCGALGAGCLKLRNAINDSLENPEEVLPTFWASQS
jgi:hypothetical protein